MKDSALKTQKKRELRRHSLVFLLALLSVAGLSFGLFQVTAYAASPQVTLELGSGQAGEGVLGTLELLFLFMLLALAPAILMMMTSFTRIIIVLSFLRNALGTQQSPPNQILLGMALFLTLFIMNPVLSEINREAYTPYKEGAITQEVALERAIEPMKVFMLKQTQSRDLNLFLSLQSPDGEAPQINSQEDLEALSLQVIVPAFITSELGRAFTMGFLLFIPFLIIDLVVSSTLMSMGMVMLPPSMIAMPFKLMMFVLVDGWGLLFETLVRSFR